MIIAAWRRWLNKPIPLVEKLDAKMPKYKENVKAYCHGVKKEIKKQAEAKAKSSIDRIMDDIKSTATATFTSTNFSDSTFGPTGLTGTTGLKGPTGTRGCSGAWGAFDKGMEALDKGMSVLDKAMGTLDGDLYTKLAVRMTKMHFSNYKDKWGLSDGATLTKILENNKYKVNKIIRAYVKSDTSEVVVEFLGIEPTKGTTSRGPR